MGLNHSPNAHCMLYNIKTVASWCQLVGLIVVTTVARRRTGKGRRRICCRLSDSIQGLGDCINAAPSFGCMPFINYKYRHIPVSNCYKFTAPIFLVDYVLHILLETNESSVSSKVHGPLLTLIRWSAGFAT